MDVTPTAEGGAGEFKAIQAMFDRKDDFVL